MKTPEEYKKMVNSKILTTEMIATVIYSLNKRAKNWKDKNPAVYRKAKKYRFLSLVSDSPKYAREADRYKVLEYYKHKDYILMALFQPTLIHVINGMEYLYYKVHRSDYHLPGYIYELYGFDSLPPVQVVEVKDFFTRGEAVYRLLPVRFCNSVIELIKQGDFVLVDGEIMDYNKKNIKKIFSDNNNH
ncbi:MAG: hypothetical protein GY754_46235 [bacterium]|nr:hypothetical protein [bacterium]